jgi:sterol desaturase/sphingolipid hydroxylase (fatty acid hydroxylase superfamily)
MLDAFFVVYAGLILLGLFFAAAQRRWPASPSPPIWHRDRFTDFVYWLFTPIVTGSLTRAATFGVIALFTLFAGADVRLPWAAAVLPVPLQVLLALLVTDFVGYWSHRFRHMRALWPFHSIHHAATDLDWFAAARMHPVDDIVDNVCVGLSVLSLGFDPRIFAMLGPLLLLHTLLTHANVAWNFGPLRFVLVSPSMHRWHHARELGNHPCNFAGMFAFFDLLFGSFHLPDSQPLLFGVTDETLPRTVAGQLAYPFRTSGL